MATRSEDERLLTDFKESGSRDSLLALLRAHQDRVYNVCFQVLGRTEDAEDATQNALLKLAEGARIAPDADAFAGWIYRVSLRAALDVWRRRETARHHEKRSAMTRPNSVPFDDPERRALFEAMDRLSDGERALVVQHYFEKVPLEELGAKRGLSAVAIWKRIDRAREKLKKLLLGAGFAAASGRVAEALESLAPAAPPATFASEAVLQRILEGGLAVSVTKNVGTVVVAAALLAGFGLGAGTVLVIRARTARQESVADGSSMPPAKAPVVLKTPAASPTPAVESQPSAAEPAPVRNRLRERLEEYKAWFIAWRASAATAPKPKTPEESTRKAMKANRESRRQLEGVKELIYEDPDTFFEFILDPQNEQVSGMLIGHALDSIDYHGDTVILKRQNYANIPPPVMEGFARVLESGPAPMKGAVLEFLAQVDGAPGSLQHMYRNLLRDGEPAVQASAIRMIGRQQQLKGDVLEEIKELALTTPHRNVRSKAIEAISHALSSDAEQWLLDRLEANRDPDLVMDLSNGLRLRLYSPHAMTAKTLDRYTAVLGGAVVQRTNEAGYYGLICCILLLPADRSPALLDAALPQAPNEKLSQAVMAVLEKIRSGEEAPKALLSHFSSIMYPPK